MAALELSKGRDVEYTAALALGFSGEYSRSAAFADDLEKRFPEDTFAKFGYVPVLRALAALGRGKPADSVEGLQIALPYELATEPQAADMSRHRLRPLATEDYAETSPVWSPDGKSIAYLAVPKSGFELQVKSLDESPPVALGVSGRQPSWSPDESRLYYIRQTGNVFGPVFSVSRAGGEPTQVTQQEVFAAAISPDGRTLAALIKEVRGGRGSIPV